MADLEAGELEAARAEPEYLFRFRRPELYGPLAESDAVYDASAAAGTCVDVGDTGDCVAGKKSPFAAIAGVCDNCDGADERLMRLSGGRGML